MKTRFALLSLAVAALSFTSCIKDEIVQKVYENTMNVVNINVPEDSWEYSISAKEESDLTKKYQGNYYVASVSVPEITASVCKGGLVKVYRFIDTDTQVELPYTRHYEDYDSAENTSYFYTETIDYEFTEGMLYIYVTDNDFAYEEDSTIIPPAMSFRLVIIE